MPILAWILTSMSTAMETNYRGPFEWAGQVRHACALRTGGMTLDREGGGVAPQAAHTKQDIRIE